MPYLSSSSSSSSNSKTTPPSLSLITLFLFLSITSSHSQLHSIYSGKAAGVRIGRQQNYRHRQLTVDYYETTCPQVEKLVGSITSQEFQQAPVSAPATIRLFFHDCFVEGCDGSILIATKPGSKDAAEKDAPENKELAPEAFDTVSKAKALVESHCPGVVSCADILALAARDFVHLGLCSKFEFGERKNRERASMATPRVDIKGFYKPKKNAGVSKTTKSTRQKKPSHSATFGSDVAQTPALVSHGGSLDLKDDYEDKEVILREFDMNMAYGPCLGMTRIARWERADRLGLNPPEEVKTLLTSGNANLECLWDGRV